MGRLIGEEDAVKVIYNLLKNSTVKPTSAMESYGLEETARLLVSSIPTAFNVEAVVGQIEEYIDACENCKCPSTNLINCEDHPYCSSCRNEWLRMIVRKGGVE